MILLLAVVVAVAWTWASGAGHLTYANSDWVKHDAVLADLAHHPWPVTYLSAPDGDMVLRYYTGLYIVPALATKVFGRHDLWMLLWVGLGVVLSLALVLRGIRRMRTAVVVAVTFVAFSGVDVVAWYARNRTNGLDWVVHLDHWIPLQYNSMTTLLFWVPQHALAGWLGFQLVGSRSRRAATASAPLVLLMVGLWSPFVAVGLLPFVVLQAWRGRASLRAAWPRIAACWATMTVAAAPVLAMLLSDAGSTPRSWYWELRPRGWQGELALFVAVEVLLPLVAVRCLARGLVPEVRLAVAVLLVLPAVVIGAYNDFAMRASIPALFVLFLALRDGIVAWIDDGRRLPGWLARVTLATTIVLLGSATAVPEVVRAVDEPDSEVRFAATDPAVPMLVSTGDYVPRSQYLAQLPPSWGRVLRHQEAMLRAEPVAAPEPVVEGCATCAVGGTDPRFTFWFSTDALAGTPRLVAFGGTRYAPGRYRVRATIVLDRDLGPASLAYIGFGAPYRPVVSTGKRGVTTVDELTTIPAGGSQVLQAFVDNPPAPGVRMEVTGIRIDRLDPAG